MATQAVMRVLIVDDEAPARARIRHLLRSEKGVEVIGECSNGREAVDAIIERRPDLVFLDIKMPGLSGVEVLEAVARANALPPLAIFVTAYDAYALKAFELHAIDYLLKPFDRERFEKTMAHAREQFARAQETPAAGNLMTLLKDLRTGLGKPGRIVYKENGRIVLVPPESLDWIEADGNYVRLHAAGESHYFRETLASLEAQLPPGMFMRISRSAIVNIERIKELQPLFYGDYAVILRNGTRLNMSRTHKNKLDDLLGQR